MTQEELHRLPEIQGVVLYVKEDKDPIMMIDENGVDWFVGWYHGIYCKSKAE